MPHGNYKGRDIVCPFYAGEDDKQIKCEGFEEETKTCVCFATKAKKAGFEARWCKSMNGYKRCWIAKALLEKYQA